MLYGATGFLYRNLLKPVLFLLPADKVHNGFLRIGSYLGRHSFTKRMVEVIRFEDKNFLGQDICGIKFENPIGLAAGFDYNADLVKILPSIGFGFHTVGTVTNEAYQGNSRPMLGRLPKSKSLLVNKGFKNDGISKILERLSVEKAEVPYGLSIGSTNKKYESFGDLVEDITSTFQKAESNKSFSYYELNISCPNLENIEDLSDKVDMPHGFDVLLESLGKLGLSRPVFIKMPVEKDTADIDRIMEVAKQHLFVKGFIFANLVKDRNNPALNKAEVNLSGKGNFSGKPTFELSNKLIRHAFRKYGEHFIIIGCGGVFTAEDAYKKIKLGASLVQLVTGMVYMGPTQIGVINQGLLKLIKKDGFKNIKDVVGVDAI